MRGWLDTGRLGCGLSAAWLATSAMAQTVPPETGQGSAIVVTGQIDAPAKVIERFVTQVMDAQEGQYARFADPVCPEVVGLSPKVMQAMQSRIREVAAQTAVPLSKKPKCQSNMLVMFVADTDSFMKYMRNRYRRFFSDLGDGDKATAFQPGSIRAWRQLVLRDDVGTMGLVKSARSAPKTAPIYETPTRTVAVNAVVILDKTAASGRSVRQLADYAAFRALTGARPPATGRLPLDSILSLFDPQGTPPVELTATDRGLIASLYTMRGNMAELDAGQQAASIGRRMAAAKARAEAEVAARR